MNLKLDELILRKFCEDDSKKQVLALEEPEIVEEFLKYIQMQNEFMKTTSAYEIASTMRSFSTWYSNKDLEPKKNLVSHREVYYVDLGGYNLKYEGGFIHPCLVIRSYGSSVLVIPGSSKKYNRGDDLIFDIKAKNGFKENTGLLLDQVRCISTTRLISRLGHGKVSSEVFGEVIEKFMEKYLSKQFHEFSQLRKKNVKLQEQTELHQENIIKLEEENEELKRQISELGKIVAKIEKDA